MAPRTPHREEPDDTVDFLNNLRIKALAAFIGILMVLYSFFGSIYRVPVQLELHEKSIVASQAVFEKHVADNLQQYSTLNSSLDKIEDRLTELEKTVVGRTELLTEAGRTRGRVDTIEKTLAAQSVMQEQLAYLRDTTKILTQQFDALSIKLTELTVHINNIKEAEVETRRLLDENRKKQP